MLFKNAMIEHFIFFQIPLCLFAFTFILTVKPPLIDNVVSDVSQFNHMLHMHHTPPIIEYKLGSLMKMKHYPIAISLSKEMEVRKIGPDLVTLNILSNNSCSAFSLCTKCFLNTPNTFFIFSKIIPDKLTDS